MEVALSLYFVDSRTFEKLPSAAFYGQKQTREHRLLFLRPFTADSIKLPSREWRWRSRSLLAEVEASRSALGTIAYLSPGATEYSEWATKNSGHRRFLFAEKWNAEIYRELKESSEILIVGSGNGATMWEYHLLIELGMVGKAIVCFPSNWTLKPTSKDYPHRDKWWNSTNYARLKNVLAVSGRVLPDLKALAVILFQPPDTVIVTGLLTWRTIRSAVVLKRWIFSGICLGQLGNFYAVANNIHANCLLPTLETAPAKQILISLWTGAGNATGPGYVKSDWLKIEQLMRRFDATLNNAEEEIHWRCLLADGKAAFERVRNQAEMLRTGNHEAGLQSEWEILEEIIAARELTRVTFGG
jgi:hypothetical protein